MKQTTFKRKQIVGEEGETVAKVFRVSRWISEIVVSYEARDYWIAFDLYGPFGWSVPERIRKRAHKVARDGTPAHIAVEVTG